VSLGVAQDINSTAMGMFHTSRGEKKSSREKKELLGLSVGDLSEIYRKGTSLANNGSQAAAIDILESALPIISASASQLSSSVELRKSTELILTKLCVLSSHAIRNSKSSWLEAETLAAFRAWADFWMGQSGPTNTVVAGHAPEADVSRRQVWKEYYATLSYILQADLTYPTTALATAYNDHALRLVQREELMRVETTYEALLLEEVQFPKAEDHSEEVEEWVDIVMKNWRVLCGTNWQEQSLGAGGRDAVSRGVLEILYRAATKTFHSTRILRHLFTVHLAVADFDLAFKAFDTYFDIVKKGNQRVEKTGEQEPGLDSNENVLRTASQCIRALCRYGGLSAAEKAKDLAHFLESWLEKHDLVYVQEAVASGNGNGNSRLVKNGHFEKSQSISPHVIAHAWRSIGISSAQWARLTYDANARQEFQLKAIAQLRRALKPEYGCTDDVDTLYALALVHSERRQLGDAIQTVGAALALHQSSDGPPHSDSYSGRFSRERSLISLWHLLALLLSAKEEFSEAYQACESAFKQFGNLRILFGENTKYQSEHLNGLEEKPAIKPVIDDMDDFEKETILEVKITQLVLIEVQDGPDVALNGTEELLSLYSRLFGAPQTSAFTTPKPSQRPPATATSTLRSIKGSIFGRSRRSVREVSGATTATNMTEKTNTSSRPQTAQTVATVAPKIQVTGEKGEGAKRTVQSQHGQPANKAASVKGDHLLRKKSQASMRKRDPPAPRVPQSQVGIALSPETFSEKQDLATRQIPTAPRGMSQQEAQMQSSRSNAQERLPNKPLSLSSATPVPRFPAEQARRHRIGILIKVWLLIAGFYRGAELYDDAKLSIDAAYELVSGLEADVLNDTSGTISIDNPGWGIGKCVEKLFADICAEVSLSPPYPSERTALTSPARLPLPRPIPPLHRPRPLRGRPHPLRRPPLRHHRPLQHPPRHPLLDPPPRPSSLLPHPRHLPTPLALPHSPTPRAPILPNCSAGAETRRGQRDGDDAAVGSAGGQG
jgi:tetratricopeptide (TPR) repeat protein